ncbi:hypothetical protein K6L44_06460 [Gluconacetobacter entanii]|uniref:hypothetical protein n=1 Tax=Gluconacetobacter entanii TaxID=108528 RepID=UPI001C934ADE|nr:hypothetical protein [Gluconacetobacter entanii]MBY4639643.1 hypothetical protein [Gluconacetobacter entanii]MCW4579662.1 hypothetical protein [Gluconacetobacter entanii]MCW4583067.1 hypothetical protein [Gluconacetobacter entanii]MCW4586428.1 hypothetical protein [Gluconacetobacter entanii]
MKQTMPLTVRTSFPESLSQSLTDLIGRRSLDFASILCDEFLRDLVTRSKDETTGLADDLVIAPRLPVADFDAKVSAALGAFRAELQAS